MNTLIETGRLHNAKVPDNYNFYSGILAAVEKRFTSIKKKKMYTSSSWADSAQQAQRRLETVKAISKSLSGCLINRILIGCGRELGHRQSVQPIESIIDTGMLNWFSKKFFDTFELLSPPALSDPIWHYQFHRLFRSMVHFLRSQRFSY